MKKRLLVIILSMVLCGIIGSPNSSHAEENKIQNRGAKVPYAYNPIFLHEGGYYPVVGVKKKKALIDVNGRLVSVKRGSKVYIFATHFLVLPSIQTGVERMGWENITPISGSLTNAYGLFISYNDSGVADLDWRNLKDTPKGKKLTVKSPLPPGSQGIRKPSRYLFLAFQGGKELIPLSSPQRKSLLSLLERKSMAEIVGSYLKETNKEEADPSPIFKPEFDLSESEYKLLQGKEVAVNVVITQWGTISKATLDGNVPALLSNKILGTVRLWKFLPAISGGKAVSRNDKIRLEF